SDGIRGVLEMVATAFESIRFDEIAANINRGLDSLYNGIKWDAIGEQITRFTAAVTKAFNDLLALDFGMLGGIIGAGIADIVRAFNQLTGEGGIDFEGIGKKISDGMRGMVANIPWEELGNALGNGFMLGWRILDGFISGMAQQNNAGLNGWGELGVSLANAVKGLFDKIDFGAIGQMLVDAFNGIIESLKNFVMQMESNGTWQSIADNISRGLNNAISGVKPIEAAQALGQFVTDLLHTMLDVAQSTPWDELGKKIGQALAAIPWSDIFWTTFDIISTVLTGLFGGLASEILDHMGEIGTALADGFNQAFERLREFTASVDWSGIATNIYTGLNNMIHGIDWAAAGQTLSNFVMKLLNVFWEVAKNTDWEGFGRGVGEFLSNIDWMGIIGKVFDILWDVFSGFISGLFDTNTGKVVVGIGAGMALLEGLFEGVKVILAAQKLLKALTEVVGGIGTLFSPTSLVVLGIIAAAALIIANWDKISEVALNLWNNVLVPFGKFLGEVFVSIWEDMLSPALEFLAKEVLPPLIETLENLWNNVMVPLGEFVASVLAPIFEGLIEVLSDLWKNVIVPVAEAIGTLLVPVLDAVWAILNDLVIPVLSEIIKVLQDLWDNLLKPIVDWIGDVFGPILETAFSALGTVLSILIEVLGGFVEFFAGVISGCGEALTSLIKTIGEMIDNIGEILGGIIDFIVGVFTGDWERAWDGVVSIFKGIFNTIPTIAEGIINIVIGLINGIIKGINKVTGIVPGDPIPDIPTIPKVKLPRFAAGGFPEDGLFFANHNELVGKFTNGQTAVANNQQIVEGIKYGVREAVSEVLAPYLADIAQNTRKTADKDMSVRIGDRDVVSSYDRGKARQGYSFTPA
ncbi:MAG: hypothetical protein NC489_42360, partial [Ruminococcus flavefaciens]|nr:hypothetical protein [Ruminococcus flavefaciens]